MPESTVIVATAGGIGTVAGFLLRYFTNGKISSNGNGRPDTSAAEAEFRGQMRQLMESQTKTMDKMVDLMNDVHREIAHTNEVLEIVEQRGRGSDEAIAKILGRSQ